MLGGGFGGLRGFFNAYGAYPGIWVKKDGQLAYGAIQPECKTALAVLHDMYEKGYIDTEFGVKDSTKAGEAAAAGKYGFTFGQQWLSLTPFQSCKDNDPDAVVRIPASFRNGRTGCCTGGSGHQQMDCCKQNTTGWSSVRKA